MLVLWRFTCTPSSKTFDRYPFVRLCAAHTGESVGRLNNILANSQVPKTYADLCSGLTQCGVTKLEALGPGVTRFGAYIVDSAILRPQLRSRGGRGRPVKMTPMEAMAIHMFVLDKWEDPVQSVNRVINMAVSVDGNGDSMNGESRQGIGSGPLALSSRRCACRVYLCISMVVLISLRRVATAVLPGLEHASALQSLPQMSSWWFAKAEAKPRNDLERQHGRSAQALRYWQ